MSDFIINNFRQKLAGRTIYRDLLVCVFLVIVTFFVYEQVRTFEYINYDDNEYIVDNQVLANGFTWENVIWAFTDSIDVSNYWHPLAWISHLIDVELYGMNLGGHHLTNLIFHILNTVLLFIVFRKMTGSTWRSGFIAALFALHPLHVESVAWLAERKDVMSGFFWMLTLWAYWRYANAPGLKNYLLVFLFFLMGLMSKPMLVTLPFVLLLLDIWPLGRIKIGQSVRTENRKHEVPLLSLIVEKIPLFLIIIPASISTFLTQDRAGAVHSLDVVPLYDRFANCMVSYVKYIEKMIWPTGLAFIYPNPGSPPVWQSVGAGLLLLAITFFAVYYIKRYPWFTVGWFWYLGVMFPVNGLVVIGPHVMADRYTYLPLIGLFIIVSWGSFELVKNRPHGKQLLVASTVIILTIFSLVTHRTAGYWKNTITACERALEVTDNNYVAHNNLGFVLAGQGNQGEAVWHYTEALRIEPDCILCMNNQGNALIKLGRTSDAIRLYSESLGTKPDQAGIHYRLGNALRDTGKMDEAISHYRKALQLEPLVGAPYMRLGDYFFSIGKVKVAIDNYRKALKIDPNQGDAHNSLAIVLTHSGMLAQALYHGRHAMRLNPDDPEIHNNMGIILAMQGRISEAVWHLQKALKLRPDYPDARDNLHKVLSAQKQP